MFPESPTANPLSLSLPLLKPKPRSRTRVTIQATPPLWADVHWIDRAYLCPGAAHCAACAISNPRTKGYMAVLASIRESTRPVLLEINATEWSRLGGLCRMDSHDLRPGLTVEVTRPRTRSPIRLEPIGPGGPVDPELGARHRLLTAVAILYRLPTPRAGEDPAASEARIVDAAAKAVARVC